MIGMKRFLVGSAAAAGVLVAGTISANTALIDFSGGGVDLGRGVRRFSSGAITVRANAFEVAKSDTHFETYTEANLFQRDDDPVDHGIGVCNSEDDFCVKDDQNEIDNNGILIDIIRLDVAGLDLLTLRLSSLDGTAGNIDDAEIYFSDQPKPDLSSLDPLITANEISEGVVEPEFDISGGRFQGFKHIFILPAILGGDDDFLLFSLGVRDDGAAQLFNARINVAGKLLKAGEQVIIAARVVEESGPIEVFTTTATVTITTLPVFVVSATVEVQYGIIARSIRRPGRIQVTGFDTFSLRGTTVEGPVFPQPGIDIRGFAVQQIVGSLGEGKGPVEEREAKVEFEVLFAPDAEGRFSADFDLGGQIQVVPQP